MENNKKNIWGHTQNAQINAARSINSDTYSKSAHDKFETDSIICFYAKERCHTTNYQTTICTIIHEYVLFYMEISAKTPYICFHIIIR